MGSLFDLAADLSQYAEETPHEDGQDVSVLHALKPRGMAKATTSSIRNDVSTTSSNQEMGEGDAPMSTLSILDEALMAIYEARRPQHRQTEAEQKLTSQRSAPSLLLSTSARTDERAKTPPSRIRSTSLKTANPLQNVFSQSLTVKATTHATGRHAVDRIPPPPPAPPAPPTQQLRPTRCAPTTNSSKIVQDPDLAAKSALREVQEEIEQLPLEAMTSATQIQRHQRLLLDKYVGSGLNLLPSTSFVLLAKRKIQQKIEQLSVKPPTKLLEPQPVTPPTTAATLPPAQYEMLVKLSQIPDSHVAKLSSTQQKMVQFAKRYDKILKLSSDELQRLPVSQAQLLQQLRDQLPRDSRPFAS